VAGVRALPPLAWRTLSGRTLSWRALSWRALSWRALPWTLTAAAVLVQIGYPLVPLGVRAPATVASVLVFCAASLTDAARVQGLRGAAVLLAVAGGGGLLVEAVGVHTGLPFGTYAYTGGLGAAVLGVPAVVPLAWTMMAWPALVVGRTLGRVARRWPVALLGGAALATWDVFLDPQMVDAGYWTWAHPQPALPLVPGVPLSNYAGWLVVAVVMVGALDRLLPRAASPSGPSGPAAALYLWTYGSSVLAHVAFFGRPGSALVGGLVMGAVALPFARALWVAHGGDGSARRRGRARGQSA
jgi:putative membrane protein